MENDTKFNMKIKSVDQIMLLEINERIKNAVDDYKNNYGELNELDYKMLEADKESLSKYDDETTSFSKKVFANNLRKKIEFIFEILK